MPGVSRGIGRQSGADTKVLRIEQVWAHDLELDGLVVNRRRADQPLTQPPAAARQQRQAHPAVALNRGGGGGHVARTGRASLRCDELQAVSQTVRARQGTYADELQALGRREAGALRQRAADEITLLLQHPLQAEIIGAGVAVQLCGGHVTLLDAQGVDRKSTRLNSRHPVISYAVFCLKKKKVTLC